MISNVQIFTWIGINLATVRNALIVDFLSGGDNSISAKMIAANVERCREKSNINL